MERATNLHSGNTKMGSRTKKKQRRPWRAKKRTRLNRVSLRRTMRKNNSPKPENSLGIRSKRKNTKDWRRVRRKIIKQWKGSKRKGRCKLQNRREDTESTPEDKKLWRRKKEWKIRCKYRITRGFGYKHVKTILEVQLLHRRKKGRMEEKS